METHTVCESKNNNDIDWANSKWYKQWEELAKKSHKRNVNLINNKMWICYFDDNHILQYNYITLY